LSQYSAVDLGCILGTQRKDIRRAYKEDIVDSSANTETESSVVQSSGPNSETDEKKTKKDKKKKKRDMKEEEIEEDVGDVAKISFAQNEDSLPKSPATEKKEELLDEDGKRKSSFLTLNRGSMNAYFEQKMAAMKFKLASAGEQSITTEEEGKKMIKSEEIEKKRKRVKTAVTTEDNVPEIKIKAEKEDNTVLEQTEEKKGKKKRKRDETVVTTEEQVSDIRIKTEKEEPTDNGTEEKQRKKKRTQDDVAVMTEEQVLNVNIKTEKDENIVIEQDEEKKSKKKRKRETGENAIEINQEVDLFFIDTKGARIDESEVTEPKKKSKKSKSKQVSEDDELADSTTGSNIKKEVPETEEKVIQNLEDKSSVKEKKKKKKAKETEAEPKIKTKHVEEDSVGEITKNYVETATQEAKKSKEKKLSPQGLTPSEVEQLIGFKGAGSSVLKIKGYGNHRS